MADSFIDFDPLTEDGKEDINKDIENKYDEYENLLNEDPSGESLYDKFKQFGRGLRYALTSFKNRFKSQNPYTKIPYILETEMDDLDIIKKNKVLARDLAIEVEKLYPDYKEDDYENVLKYFRFNQNHSLEMYDPLNKTWKELDYNENKIPRVLKNRMGWSKQHINIYNNAKEKLDSWFESNKISRDTGYDLWDDDGIMKIKGPNDTKFRRLNTKSGNFYTENFKVSTLTHKIKDDLGPSNFVRRQEAEEAVKNAKQKIREIEVKKEQLVVEHQENIKKVDDILHEASDRLGDHVDRSDMIKDLQEENERIPEIMSGLEVEQGKLFKIVDTNEEIRRRLDKLKSDDDQVYASRDRLNNDVNGLEQEIDRRENDIERINERLPLRERIKEIIKKHGLTVTGIALSVGVIIGVIINSLKSGLSSVANGVGNGLKAIGKKLGDLLPGMIGAIASYIFKTAGQVIGFLAKHAWLLIVAVVLYVVERYKNKK